jgi:protoporphyrinogen oxidase
MGYFMRGKLYRWGDPLALMRFPFLGPVDKLRYGWHVYRASKRDDWSALHGTSARDWIVREAGEKVWDRMWARSFERKFYEFTDQIAAPWLGARIKRLASSNTTVSGQDLGYLDGGSDVLVRALVAAIEANGGRLYYGTPARRVDVVDGRVEGVETEGEYFPADFVISTIPTPLVSPLVPDLPEPFRARYEAIKNIGAVCVVLKLRRSVTPHFWVNINDPDVDVPGIVEFSHLRPLGEHVVYVPFYMPQSNEKFHRSDREFVDESTRAVRRLNGTITPDDVVDAAVSRLRYAQPVCETGFPALLPPTQTPIRGLQIADTSFYYPEDRGISESVRVANEMVTALGRRADDGAHGGPVTPGSSSSGVLV